MEIAINRHFEDRNIYFPKKTKRVIHKTWDKKAFDTNKIQGGLFKKCN